jgi:hypothetical protein
METDHTAVLPYLLLQDFPTTHFTFEAWISSSDFCHAGEQGQDLDQQHRALEKPEPEQQQQQQCNTPATHQLTVAHQLTAAATATAAHCAGRVGRLLTLPCKAASWGGDEDG